MTIERLTTVASPIAILCALQPVLPEVLPDRHFNRAVKN